MDNFALGPRPCLLLPPPRRRRQCCRWMMCDRLSTRSISLVYVCHLMSSSSCCSHRQEARLCVLVCLWWCFELAPPSTASTTSTSTSATSVTKGLYHQHELFVGFYSSRSICIVTSLWLWGMLVFSFFSSLTICDAPATTEVCVTGYLVVRDIVIPYCQMYGGDILHPCLVLYLYHTRAQHNTSMHYPKSFLLSNSSQTPQLTLIF